MVSKHWSIIHYDVGITSIVIDSKELKEHLQYSTAVILYFFIIFFIYHEASSFYSNELMYHLQYNNQPFWEGYWCKGIM